MTFVMCLHVSQRNICCIYHHCYTLYYVCAIFCVYIYALYSAYTYFCCTNMMYMCLYICLSRFVYSLSLYSWCIGSLCLFQDGRCLISHQLDNSDPWFHDWARWIGPYQFQVGLYLHLYLVGAHLGYKMICFYLMVHDPPDMHNLGSMGSSTYFRGSRAKFHHPSLTGPTRGTCGWGTWCGQNFFDFDSDFSQKSWSVFWSY